MVSVSIQITGTDVQIAKLGKLGASFLNFDMAMKSIGDELTSYFANQVYVSQGGAIDERWPALARSTKVQKAKKYPGAGPLIRTGEMKNSYDFETPDVNSVVIGNTAAHFPYHQSKAPRRHLPRRATIGTGGQVKTIVGKIIDADIRTKLQKAGL